MIHCSTCTISPLHTWRLHLVIRIYVCLLVAQLMLALHNPHYVSPPCNNARYIVVHVHQSIAYIAAAPSNPGLYMLACCTVNACTHNPDYVSPLCNNALYIVVNNCTC